MPGPPLAGRAYPVPPLDLPHYHGPGSVIALGDRPAEPRRSRDRRRRRSPVLDFLDPIKGVRGHLPRDVPEGRHRRSTREVKKPTAPRFHGHHQLNRWPDGLEKCIGCELCAWACPADAIYVEGRDNTDEERYSPGERYGARLPDQLPALHPVRAVHRGLPDPGADDDQRVRAGRRQPREPDLDQGAAAGPAAARHGGASAPDAARRRRAGLLPARPPGPPPGSRAHVGAGQHPGRPRRRAAGEAASARRPDDPAERPAGGRRGRARAPQG